MPKPNNQQIISIRLIPGSKTQQIVGFMGNGALKIKIRAKPIEGRANKELIKVLAEILVITESSIEIISGITSRNKQVKILDIEREELIKIIDKAIIHEP